MNSKLKGYRVMAGYTQEEIATVLQVSRQAYNMKENGINGFSQKERHTVFDTLKQKLPTLTFDELFPIED